MLRTRESETYSREYKSRIVESSEIGRHEDPDALHGEGPLKETDDVAASILVRERRVPNAPACKPCLLVMCKSAATKD